MVYDFIDIEASLGWVWVAALNDDDQLTGHTDKGLAFVSDLFGGLKTLQLPGSLQNDAVDINAYGHAVGWALMPPAGPPPVLHAFHYDGHKLVDLTETLKPLNLTSAAATAINDAGDIIGSGQRKGSSDVVGWLITKGEAIDLNAKTGHVLEPISINNVGRMIGSTGDGTPFWLDVGSKHITKLQGAFHAINDKQQIAGVNTFGNAVVFGEDSSILKLSDGPASPTGITNDGIVVGNLGDGTGHPFVCDSTKPEEGVSDLTGLLSGDVGAGALHVGPINNYGEVIGYIRHSPHADVMSLLLRPIDGTLKTHDFVGPDISRIAAAIQILFGVVDDAPGLGHQGKRPRRFGPGPDDPMGPLGRATATLNAAERDVLVGLGLRQLGSLVQNPVDRSEVRRVATRVVANAAAQMTGQAAATPASAGEALTLSTAVRPIERLRELRRLSAR